MKLVIYHNVIAPYKKRFFEAICRHFPGHVTLFTSSKQRRLRTEWGEQEIDAPNLEIKRLPAINRRGIGWYNPSIFYQILRADFDVLMTGDYHFASALLSTWAAKIKDKPCALYTVATRRSSLFEPDSGPVRRLLDKVYQTVFVEEIIERTITCYDSYLTPSETSIEHLLGYGIDEDRIVQVYNPVDTEKFNPATAPEEEFARHASAHDFIICYVGRLVEEKGLHTLLDAINQIEKDICVLIAGNGPLDSELRNHVREDNLDEQVQFLGYVPHGRIPGLHPVSELFVLPSQPKETNVEQFPNALLEAMASGLPAVTFDIEGGIKEIHVDGVTGTKASELSADSLAGAIERALQGEKEQFGRNARERIVENFSADSIGKVYADELARLATESRTETVRK